jgi:hypothetical protein
MDSVQLCKDRGMGRSYGAKLSGRKPLDDDHGAVAGEHFRTLRLWRRTERPQPEQRSRSTYHTTEEVTGRKTPIPLSLHDDQFPGSTRLRAGSSRLLAKESAAGTFRIPPSEASSPALLKAGFVAGWIVRVSETGTARDPRSMIVGSKCLDGRFAIECRPNHH